MEQENSTQREAKPLGELLSEAPLTAAIPAQSSQQEEQETTFSDVDLTPEELAAAVEYAKEKKRAIIQENQREQRRQELRQYLTQPWSFGQTRDWITGRIRVLFPEDEIIYQDVNSTDGTGLACNAGSVFNLLCLYFCSDPGFTEAALKLKVKRPDLRKGILLAGGVGRGKTTIMQLFQRNPRQVYFMKNAKEIAGKWREAKENGIEYLQTMAQAFQLPVNDVQNFYHRAAGLCIDDVATEDVQNSYGNKASVIGDLLELRYYYGATGPLLHMTTNFTTKMLKETYGDRVSSRMRETMNIIDYIGEDRR